jgi:hypothetical protein
MRLNFYLVQSYQDILKFLKIYDNIEAHLCKI